MRKDLNNTCKYWDKQRLEGIPYVYWQPSDFCTLMRRNFSFVAFYLLQDQSLLDTRRKTTRYSFQNSPVSRCKLTRCSLLVVKLLLTRAQIIQCKKLLASRCKIRLLLVVEVVCCKISLVTRCKICSWLVAEAAWCKKIIRYSLQSFMILVAELANWKRFIVTLYEIYLLLVAEVARIEISLSLKIISNHQKKIPQEKSPLKVSSQKKSIE